MGGGVRVRYSGLILFAGNLASFLLGFVFSVLIARNLSLEDMGVWFFLGSVLAYFEIVEKALPYWATRDSARGEMITRTSIFVNFLVSLPPTLLFMLLSPFFSSLIDAPLTVFLIGGLLIPLYYVSSAEVAVITALCPHLSGPRAIIIDAVKIVLSLVLLGYGLPGILFAVVVANLVFIVYGWVVLRRWMEPGLKLKWAWRRLRHFWLPLQRHIAGYVKQAADVFILGAMTSAVALSSYGIALTISRTFKAANSLTSAIYPKLISKKGMLTMRELESVFKFQYMFTVPMLVGGLVLAPNLITIFGSKYLEGVPSLLILIPSGFMGTVSNLLRNLVRGAERVDETLEVGFGRLLRSRLFLAEAASYLSMATIIAASILTIPMIGAMGAAVARLSSDIISLTFFTALYSRVFPLKPALSGVFKPAAAALPMAVLLFLFPPVGSVQTLLWIVWGALVYFATLYLLDAEARGLWRAARREVASRLHLFGED